MLTREMHSHIPRIPHFWRTVTFPLIGQNSQGAMTSRTRLWTKSIRRGRERARDKNRERPGPSENQAIEYPASSWFLLRQTREKPLRTNVCFSTEHERARHAPRNAFDVNFICQLIFRLKRLYKEYKGMQISHQNCWQENDPNLHRSIVYL